MSVLHDVFYWVGVTTLITVAALWLIGTPARRARKRKARDDTPQMGD